MRELTDTFTRECHDCGRTVRVVGGVTRRHWCRCPRRLRGRTVEAWLEGYDYGHADASVFRRGP